MIPIRDHYESIEAWARALSQSLLSNELTSKDLDQQNILGLIDALAGKVEVAGDTMTGALTLSGAPTVPLHASTKQYVDDVVAGGGFLPLTGGVMTGKITLDGNPTVALHAVPRQYVDAGDAFDDTKHGVRGGGNLHADAVAGGADGFMKGTDKTKLNGIAAGATVDQSAGEIKTAYESNANTNEFDDTEQTKLAGIETGAKDDLTASEIMTLIKTVDGGGSGLDADLLDGANLNDAAQAGSVARRDGSADLAIRLLRQTYGSANGDGSYFLTQNAIGTSDNYARPMSLANVRAVLGGSGNGLDADKLDSLHAADFVKKDGSVAMSGLLTLSGDPSLAMQAGTKQYIDNVAAGVAHYPEGLIYGYPSIWNSVNYIIFQEGHARDYTDVDNIIYTSIMGKLINAAWVAGGGNGGMEPTQVVAADTWYNCFVIKNRTSGAVDFLFAKGTFEPLNYPTGYTICRRIGSVLTDGAKGIIGFYAHVVAGGGLEFAWKVPILDYTGTFTTTAANLRISVPGYVVKAILYSSHSSSSSRVHLLSDPNLPDTAPTLDGPGTAGGGSYGGNRRFGTQSQITTDNTGTIRHRATATVNGTVLTSGWIDPRTA